ncbi:hypothetical protein [Streptomyces mirabilis]|uniref:hypothetical protein n=1 Tax=Streptomyces mirabilis TaxID=68239 RepID=UPI00382CB325
MDYEYAYFLVHHHRDAALGEAVRRAGVRWKIEENNEQARQITGLGQYQVHRWTSWHRHVTCAMLALAFLTVQRVQHPDPEQQPPPEHVADSHTTPEHGDEQGKDGQARETSAYR